MEPENCQQIFERFNSLRVSQAVNVHRYASIYMSHSVELFAAGSFCLGNFHEHLPVESAIAFGNFRLISR